MHFKTPKFLLISLSPRRLKTLFCNYESQAISVLLWLRNTEICLRSLNKEMRMNYGLLPTRIFSLREAFDLFINTQTICDLCKI
jgi:hypothetical protein